jgi:hypothetical protein
MVCEVQEEGALFLGPAANSGLTRGSRWDWGSFDKKCRCNASLPEQEPPQSFERHSFIPFAMYFACLATLLLPLVAASSNSSIEARHADVDKRANEQHLEKRVSGRATWYDVGL